MTSRWNSAYSPIGATDILNEYLTIGCSDYDCAAIRTNGQCAQLLLELDFPANSGVMSGQPLRKDYEYLRLLFLYIYNIDGSLFRCDGQVTPSTRQTTHVNHLTSRRKCDGLEWRVGFGSIEYNELGSTSSNKGRWLRSEKDYAFDRTR